MAKYRTFTPEFKAQVVLQLLSGTKNMTDLCREHQLRSGLLYRWRDEFMANAAKAFEHENDTPPDSQQRIAELEQMVGRLTLQLEIAKKASSLLNVRRRSNET